MGTRGRGVTGDSVKAAGYQTRGSRRGMYHRGIRRSCRVDAGKTRSGRRRHCRSCHAAVLADDRGAWDLRCGCPCDAHATQAAACQRPASTTAADTPCSRSPTNQRTPERQSSHQQSHDSETTIALHPPSRRHGVRLPRIPAAAHRRPAPLTASVRVQTVSQRPPAGPIPLCRRPIVCPPALAHAIGALEVDPAAAKQCHHWGVQF
jgi:hypothetical protein